MIGLLFAMALVSIRPAVLAAPEAVPTRIDANLAPHLRAFEPLGPRLEVAVSRDGLYRITYQDLEAAGMDPDRIDPRHLTMRCQGRDVAILVTGQEDGRLDPADEILFYGWRFRGERLADFYREAMAAEGDSNNWLWQCRGDCQLARVFEKFTDENVYWLLGGNRPGPRMKSLDVSAERESDVDTIEETLRFEEQNYWWSHEFESNDALFWDEIRGRVWQDREGATVEQTIERDYEVLLPDLVPGSQPVQVVVELAARNAGSGSPGHHVEIAWNGSSQWSTRAVWDGKRRHRLTLEIPGSEVDEGGNRVHLTVHPRSPTGQLVTDPSVWLYLDWIEVRFPRRLRAQPAGQMTWHRPSGAAVNLLLEGFSPGAEVRGFEIGDPWNPRRLEGISREPDGRYRFDSGMATGARFFLSSKTGADSPDRVLPYHPPDFEKLPEWDYVLITAGAFRAGLEELAAYRGSRGLKVGIVDIADLYREFNFGIFHPVAIKNFLAHAYENWSHPPRFAVLVGSGHWNFKSSPKYPSPPIHIPPNLAFIDPWQGETDSSNLLVTLTGRDALPDIIVARLPVSNEAQLAEVIRKTIRYEAGPATNQPFRSLFISDNGPDRVADFDRIAKDWATRWTQDGHRTDRFSLNDFDCPEAGEEGCRDARRKLIEVLNAGPQTFWTYLGHASISAWANENLFRVEDIPELLPRERWPILLSLTCLDGYWIHPGQPSLVSELLFAPGGVVGALAPSGLGILTGHDRLQLGFYRGLLEEGQVVLGELALLAKVELNKIQSSSDLLHTYTIFGDPALRIRP